MNFRIILIFKWAIVEARYRDMRIEGVFDNTSFFFGETWAPENIFRWPKISIFVISFQKLSGLF